MASRSASVSRMEKMRSRLGFGSGGSVLLCFHVSLLVLRDYMTSIAKPNLEGLKYFMIRLSILR